MLRRTMAAVMAMTLIAFAGVAMGQCTIGAYTDAAGTEAVYAPTENTLFDVYVVMHVESTVAGVALNITWPPYVFPSLVGYGPGGFGINVDGPGGMNIGLGECAIGFNNQEVVIAHYSVFPLVGPGGFVEIGPNLDENPFVPVFADCADNLIPCEGVVNLELLGTIGTEDQSFGAVKSLYGN